MPTISPQVTPYYGGGQVVNPANVIATVGAPSNKFTEDRVGTLAVDNAAGNIYGLASKSGGVDTWVLLGGSSGAISAVNGTANQVTVSTTGNVATVSLPAAITAPGSLTTTTSLSATTTITAGTGITATTGNIAASSGNVSASGTLTGGTGVIATTGDLTASAGNLTLSAAGSKLVIHGTTAASDSVGTSGVMSGTPGAVTVTSSAVTASSVILFSRATTGGTPGQVSITAQSGGSFTLTSTGNETSTFNYLIIN